jgi:hypothetical protein
MSKYHEEEQMEKAMIIETLPINFKTPIYQRNAYNKYYNKNKDDEEFIAKRKAQQKIYYDKNRTKILDKKKQKIIDKNKKKDEDIIISNNI